MYVEILRNKLTLQYELVSLPLGIWKMWHSLTAFEIL